MMRETVEFFPSRRHAGRLALAAAVAGVMLVPAGAAAAGPEESTERYSFVNWDCGHPLQVDGEVTSRMLERTNPQGGDLPLTHANVEFINTWTSADGDSFTTSGRFLAKDLRITPLGGSVYEVTAQQLGQPFVVSADDRVLTRDRGNITFTFTVDTATGAFEFLGADIAGPHPGFDADLCAIVEPVIGTGSGERHTPHPLGSTEASMGYYEYLPPSYGTVDGGSPLLVTANGYGENGDGSAEALDRLLWTGIPRFIDIGGWPLDRDFVVLSTQHVEQPPGLPGAESCDGAEWPGSCVMQLQHDLGHPPQSPCTTPQELHDFIAYATTEYDVDPDRVYVTGLSCGAFGVWEYLAAYGDEQVAAAVPIAGDGRPAWSTVGCGLAEVPVWAIHGEFDDVVNPAGSVDTVGAVSGCPGATPDSAMLSIYAELGHEGWDQAYSGSEGDDIYSWLLAHERE
ncbi:MULTISPECIES: hypothetical protein [Microbacterium]|uniref:carboxylesterase family protein n=1 Tax=Microbacterium TaxID=33882 RepID=UPI00217EF314|nr:MULTISPECIES: hypothetical protein [Microbacterium]UWF76675.1 hypothetical protein JSY13_07285 [Microbacterium neungamense]WCM54825.1 hypothetical protein JRG78_07285 [Microbacterium sp. EF45047]